MSFSIGIYDLFAYTIPGFLYLYVAYELLQKLGVIKFGILNLPALPDGYGLFIFVLLLVIAHLLGHLIDPLAHWFVYRLFKPFKFSERVLPRIKNLHSDIDIKFQPKDWGLLFSMLRLRNQELARTIDTFEANSIMLRNISLGLFLLESVLIVMLRGFLACVANWRYTPYFRWIMWCARSREPDGDNGLTIRKFVRRPSGEEALENL
jgi:hypothetical protein